MSDRVSGCVGHGRPDCDECYEEAMFGPSDYDRGYRQAVEDCIEWLRGDGAEEIRVIATAAEVPPEDALAKGVEERFLSGSASPEVADAPHYFVGDKGVATGGNVLGSPVSEEAVERALRSAITVIEHYADPANYRDDGTLRWADHDEPGKFARANLPHLLAALRAAEEER